MTAPTSFDVLQGYPTERASFSEEDLDLLRSVFVPRTLPAGEFLQRAGEVARYAAFVARGCLRSFVIGARGKEHIVQFAPEQWWLADAISLNAGAPSQYFFAAISSIMRPVAANIRSKSRSVNLATRSTCCAGDADVPVRERKDRGELGRTGRSGYVAATGTHPGAGRSR